MGKGIVLTCVLAAGVALGYGFHAATKGDLTASPTALVALDMDAPGPAGAATLSLKMQRASEKGSYAEDAMRLVQQSSGTICETPTSTCTVPAAPINSPCRCADTVGQIVR